METMTAIAEYSPIEAVLADLTKRHKGIVFDVTQPSGMKAAKAAKADIAQYRIALEKARTKLKADVLERGRLIDGEAKRISTQLAVLEEPIDAQIKAEERREEEARQAAIRAEQDRLAAEERARKEAEERRLAEEREKLARERAAFEAEQRVAREKADAEARERRESEERERAVRRAEEERLSAARRKLDEDRRRLEEEAAAKAGAEREATEAAERKEREKKEAAERERKRKAAELLDARGMLDTFVKRFGHLKQFAKVVKAIESLKEPA